MTTVVNCKKDRYDLYVGRGSKWGNPFPVNEKCTRDEACDKYETYFWTSGLFRSTAELVDKTLGCYCKPLRCHGDFLVEVAEFYKANGYINKTDFEASRKGVSQSTESETFYALIVGSRSFDDYQFLSSKLDRLLANQNNITVVSGGARGADTLAERYAREHGYKLRVFPADWNKFGKSAGYRRNRQMHEFITQFSNRSCICFWDGQSRGTAHNFELCKEFDTPLQICNFNQQKPKEKTYDFIMVNGKYVRKASK